MMELCSVCPKLRFEPNFDVSSQYVLYYLDRMKRHHKMRNNAINKWIVHIEANHVEIGSPNHDEWRLQVGSNNHNLHPKPTASATSNLPARHLSTGMGACKALPHKKMDNNATWTPITGAVYPRRKSTPAQLRFDSWRQFNRRDRCFFIAFCRSPAFMNIFPSTNCGKRYWRIGPVRHVGCSPYNQFHEAGRFLHNQQAAGSCKAASPIHSWSDMYPSIPRAH